MKIDSKTGKKIVGEEAKKITAENKKKDKK